MSSIIVLAMMAGLSWPQASSAQGCPVLQGTYMCGAKGAPRSFHLNVNTRGETYAFGTEMNRAFEVVADDTDRKGNFGGPGKDAFYRANCFGGKLNVAFRINDKGGHMLSATDSYYGERGGLVRVRIIQPDSEVKGAPTVVSCSPVFADRGGASRSGATSAAPVPLRGQEIPSPRPPAYPPGDPPARLNNVPPAQQMPAEDKIEGEDGGEDAIEDRSDYFMENGRALRRDWGRGGGVLRDEIETPPGLQR